MENNKLVADLSNTGIKGYINRGYGIMNEDVTQSESGIVFDNEGRDLNVFPMFAVDFSEYIASENIRIENVRSIEMVAVVYDEAGSELDLSSEYQKCAFVSKNALDGFSTSDILPSGNYKVIGSNVVTTFDLTKFTGYTGDGKNLTQSTLADGAGINIQILNGGHEKLRYLVISSLAFVL